MLYLSFKCVRKFKFCVSPLVKRYPDHLRYVLGTRSFRIRVGHQII